MSKEHHHRADLNLIEDQAVELAQKLISGEASPDEIEMIKRWRAENPAHAAALDAAEGVWREVGGARQVLRGSETDFAGALEELRQRRKAMNRRVVLGGGTVAVAIGTVYGALNPPFKLWPSFSEITADFHTGTGEQRSVNFANNVAINLNTQTSLAVRPATAVEDSIELITGEASFEAPKRTNRLFAVLAANGKTTTDAGRFDVRYTAAGEVSSVAVTCFDGSARIEHPTAVVDLRPGQRIRYNASGISQVAAVDPTVESEWRRGIVEFRNTPVLDVIDEINRYRPGRIILINSALGQKQLNGRFRIEQMDKVLLQLRYALNVKVQRFPGGIVFLS